MIEGKTILEVGLKKERTEKIQQLSKKSLHIETDYAYVELACKQIGSSKEHSIQHVRSYDNLEIYGKFDYIVSDLELDADNVIKL